MKNVAKWLLIASLPLLIANCADKAESQQTTNDKPQYPMNPDDLRKLRNGKLSGEGGMKLFGGDDSENSSSASPIGVNSFLWRATLDTLAFMPITSADPFGGVILTDWYEDPKAQGERFKITAMILDRSLRTDAIKVSVFKQTKDAQGQWHDSETNKELGHKLEDTILTQARELRVRQGK